VAYAGDWAWTRHFAPGGLLLAVLAATADGCAWVPRSRPARPEEALELPSCSARVAAHGTGWSISRESSGSKTSFSLARGERPGSGWSAEVTEIPDAKERLPPERLLASVTRLARGLTEDSTATVTESTTPAPAHLGAGTILARVHATEGEERAGLLVKRGANVAAIQVSGPDEGACLVSLAAWGRAEPSPAAFERAWQELLDGTRPRARDGSGPAAGAAQADEYPKAVRQGFTRRSLTLPAAGFEWELWGGRPIAPGESILPGHFLAGDRAA